MPIRLIIKMFCICQKREKKTVATTMIKVPRIPSPNTNFGEMPRTNKETPIHMVLETRHDNYNAAGAKKDALLKERSRTVDFDVLSEEMEERIIAGQIPGPFHRMSE
jgi:hypothetical protein